MRKPPVEGKGSFEMRLGTYWLVRIGIVMVLTALVFFGNLAYHNFISKLGPGGKVSLLYLASAALLVAGGWWQRKAAKDSLKNYAQVLFAGGLAAVYFTTYAAYHNDHLRIITGPHRWMGAAAGVGGVHGMDRRPQEIRGAGVVRHRAGVLHLDHYPRRAPSRSTRTCC